MDSSRVPISTFNENFWKFLDDNLRDLDKEKLKLLINDLDLEGTASNNLIHYQEENNYTDVKRFLAEYFYLIQRYDLLRHLNLCHTTVGEELMKDSYDFHFPKNSIIILNIYNNITEKMEADFNKQFDELRPRAFNDTVNSFIDSRTNFTLVERLLISNLNGVGILKTIFQTLKWKLLEVEALKLEVLAKNNEYFSQQQLNKSTDNVSTYDMTKTPCGKCVIINNYVVKGEVPREGSEVDVDSVAKTFENFDFIVELKTNLDGTAMLTYLKSIVAEDHSKFSAFVCCIMSHGSSGVIKSSDNQDFQIDSIINMFNRTDCSSLFEKPKLFIVQACQGKALQTAHSNIQFDGPTFQDISFVDKTSDYLLGLAAVEGCVAVRHPRRGSWFINALTEAFEQFADMNAVKPHVVKCVRGKVIKLNDKHGTQIPKWTDTLTKRLVFRRKVRN